MFHLPPNIKLHPSLGVFRDVKFLQVSSGSALTLLPVGAYPAYLQKWGVEQSRVQHSPASSSEQQLTSLWGKLINACCDAFKSVKSNPALYYFRSAMTWLVQLDSAADRKTAGRDDSSSVIGSQFNGAVSTVATWNFASEANFLL